MVKMASESMRLEPEPLVEQDHGTQEDIAKNITTPNIAAHDIAPREAKGSGTQHSTPYVPADLFQEIATDFKDAEIGLNAKSLRGAFARSICKANHLATNKEREGCVEGVPCSKLQTCMNQADHTLSYLNTRKKNLK